MNVKIKQYNLFLMLMKDILCLLIKCQENPPQNLQSKEKQALSLFHKYMQTVTQYIFTVIEKIQEN